MRNYGDEYPFGDMSEDLAADFVIGNFEGTIPEVHKQTPDLTFSFSVATEYINRLVDAGFTHVSLANNHAQDYGQAAYTHSVTTLVEHGLIPFGEPKAAATSSITYVSDYRGSTTALVALEFTDATYSSRDLASLLQKATASSDRQVVYVHWGTEYAEKRSGFQRETAEQLVANGADLIIGHHPHVVQDIDVIHGVLVFYSLGNFVFDQYFSDEVQMGLVVTETTSGKGYEYALTPVTSIGSRGMPRVMAPFERSRFLEALAKRSDPVLYDQVISGSIDMPK